MTSPSIQLRDPDTTGGDLFSLSPTPTVNQPGQHPVQDPDDVGPRRIPFGPPDQSTDVDTRARCARC